MAAISDSGAGDTSNYFPLNTGDRWVYDYQDGPVFRETATVTGTRTINGRLATVVGSTTNQQVPNGTPTEEYYVKSAGSLALIGDNGDDTLSSIFLPARMLSLPLRAGDKFVQLDKHGIDLGADVDRDGRNDRVDVHSEVTVVGTESITTPLGDVSAMKVQTVLKQTFILSSDGTRHLDTVTVDEWYQAGVGLVRRYTYDNFEGSTSFTSSVLIAYEVGGRRSESTAPTAVSSRPSSSGIQQARSLSVEARVSEELNPTSVTADSFIVTDASGRRVNGTVYYDKDRTLFFSPITLLATGQYTARLTAASSDLAGNPMVPYEWTFAVEGGATVVSTVPAANASEVSLNPSIVIELSKAVDPTSTSYAVNVVSDHSFPESATVTLDGSSRLIVTLTAPLPRDSLVEVTLSSTLLDLMGNPSISYSWSFRTAAGDFLATKVIVAGDGISPQVVAVGDVTGDGRNDVVLVSGLNLVGADTVYLMNVYPQLPDGTLGALAQYPLVGGSCVAGSSVTIGDVDGDGRNDVVLGESDCGFEVFRQTSPGRLSSSGRIATRNGDKLRIADLNHDGRLDIVGVGRATNTASVWLQRPDGTLSAEVLYAVNHNGAEDIEVGDLNNDGLIDIAVLSASTIGVLRQQADGSFGAATYLSIGGSDTMKGLAIGDINHDGLNDLVVSTGGNRPGSRIGVFYQRPEGALSLAMLASFDMSVAVEIGDMNNDGLLDVVVAHSGWGAIGLYEQAADGSLKPEVLYKAPTNNSNPQAMAIGDINGDGLKDISLANTTATLGLLRHAPLPTRAPSSAAPQMQRRELGVRPMSWVHRLRSGPSQAAVR